MTATAEALHRAVDTNRLYTAEELLRMPSDARFELVRGELIPMSPTGAMHGIYSQRLGAYGGAYISEHGLGDDVAAGTGFLLARDPDEVLAPDWAFVAKDRVPKPLPPGYLPLAPDIVLETRSPGDTRREVALRIERWLNAGVRLAWDLDPERRALTVHRAGAAPVRLSPDDTLSGGDVLPGFTLPMKRIFPDGE